MVGRYCFKVCYIFPKQVNKSVNTTKFVEYNRKTDKIRLESGFIL